jgi:hypothetical protein
MSGQAPGFIPYYDNKSPVPAYNKAVPPGSATYVNFSTMYNNPANVNPSYPVNQGDPQKSITTNTEARAVYQYYTDTNSTIKSLNNGTPIQNFGSYRTMYAFQQGMNAAGAQGRPFYSFQGN